MTTQEANDYFAAVADRSSYKIGADITELADVLPGGNGDVWAEAMTAGVRMTGMLPYCQSEGQLAEAAQQFAAMLRSGAVSRQDWAADLLEVIIELFFASQREDLLVGGR